jgi:hypothetical protein
MTKDECRMRRHGEITSNYDGSKRGGQRSSCGRGFTSKLYQFDRLLILEKTSGARMDRFDRIEGQLQEKKRQEEMLEKQKDEAKAIARSERDKLSRELKAQYFPIFRKIEPKFWYCCNRFSEITGFQFGEYYAPPQKWFGIARSLIRHTEGVEKYYLLAKFPLCSGAKVELSFDSFSGSFDFAAECSHEEYRDFTHSYYRKTDLAVNLSLKKEELANTDLGNWLEDCFLKFYDELRKSNIKFPRERNDE